jgi:hypothetical protein
MGTVTGCRSTLRVAALLAVAATLGTTGVAASASARPAVTTFEGVFYPCTQGPPEREWISGDVLHFRGATNHNQWVTGHPLVDGFVDNVVDANINLRTGHGVAHARETLRPDGVDGTWEIRTKVTITPDGQSARGVGRGTGDLHRMTIRVLGHGDVPLAPGENACSSEFDFAVQIEGEVRGSPR